MRLHAKVNIPRIATLAICAGFAIPMAAAAVNHVVLVSIDALRPEGIETLGMTGAPTFARLRCEGVATHNARTDNDTTYTAPNHTGMITGRPLIGEEGHNYSANNTPSTTLTYEINKGSYIASAFDVAHDHGLKTAFYHAKAKLRIIEQSYSAANGAPDTTGEDNGQAKIDQTVTNFDFTSDELTAVFVEDLASEQFDFSFVHLVDPDRSGHGSNWTTDAYYRAIKRVDSYLAAILNTIETTEGLAGETVLIITTDHGGAGSAHSVPTNPENYIIPFYVWGEGVSAGDEFYSLNPTSRSDPGRDIIPYDQPQPIRNSDSGNLALGLLGLPAIPGSTLNVAQDLSVAPLSLPATAPFDTVAKRYGDDTLLDWPAIDGVSGYTVEIGDGTTWLTAPGIWPITQTCWIDHAPADGERLYRVKAEP